MDEFIKKVKDINSSADSDELKLQKLVEIGAFLKPADNAEALILSCTYGISYAQKLGRSEMEAQFFMTRAKVKIMKIALLNYVGDMANITLAPNWFQFSLESQKKAYREMDAQVKSIWTDVQSDMDKSFEALRKRPINGAVGYVYKTAGEVYGQYYLQLRLYTFNSKRRSYFKLANYSLSRWLRLDDYLILNKAVILKLRSIRKDCLNMLTQAISIFKSINKYDYLADAYLTLAFEHQGFNNPIRAKYYLTKARRLIKKHNIKGLDGNLALIKRRADR